MRNPLCIFRYLSENLPIDFPDLILKELSRLQKDLSRPLRILDLGAGPGRYWKENKLANFLISTKSELTLFDASEEFEKESFPYGMLVIRKLGLVPEDLKQIPEDNYDFVLAIDLIEHLPKSHGYSLLYEVDRVSKYSSALLTPNGFVWQPPSLNNPYNAHLSGWLPTELRKLGWNIQRGQTGLKPLYGPYGLAKYKKANWLILETLALFKIISFRAPTLAFSFIAINRRKNMRIEKHS